MKDCAACGHSARSHADRCLRACAPDLPPISGHEGRRIPRSQLCHCLGYTTHHQGDQ